MSVGAQRAGARDGGLRELGCAPEASVSLIEGVLQAGHRAIQQARVDGLAGGCQQGASGQLLAQALAAGADLLAVLAPGLGDGLEHLRPGRHSVTWLRREVGTAVEGKLLRREEDVQRPAARPVIPWTASM